MSIRPDECDTRGRKRVCVTVRTPSHPHQITRCDSRECAQQLFFLPCSIVKGRVESDLDMNDFPALDTSRRERFNADLKYGHAPLLLFI